MKKVTNVLKKLITCVSNRFNKIKRITKNINKPSYEMETIWKLFEKKT